ncbi:MAG: transcriptional regulator [Betaproteobacteria bacterium]
MGQTEAEREGGALPPIPAKRYFTIGEVADLCGLKPHVLRYWEQEFTQLRPVKRRGNRRYYQHHEVLLVRRIRHLLYEEGFTINGARNRLAEMDEPGGDDVAERIASQDGVPDLRRELGDILNMLEEGLRPIAAPAGSSSSVS